MLSSLTATAVRRGWPPAVYARLVSQLNDSEEKNDGRGALTVLLRLVTELPPSPLLFEYIAILSTDVYSLLPFTTLIAHFADQDSNSRPQSSIDLMAYLSRGVVADWALSSSLDQPELVDRLKRLGEQAVHGCRESRLFMRAIFSQLVSEDLPADLAMIAQQLTTKKPRKSHSSGSTTNEEPSNSPSSRSTVVEKGQHASSRSLRLLWLDWVLRTAQNMEYASYLKPQLDIMWPGDRLTVITYELCVTAFDCLVARPFSDSGSVPLAGMFITNRLPLLLREMAAGEPLDGVVARLFTTLDKAVVEAAEKVQPGIRAEFGISCIDLRLCDPSVLHLLHRSHTPRELAIQMPDLGEMTLSTYSWEAFLGHDLVCQQYIARGFVKLARGPGLSRPAMANHCWQLFSNEQLCNAVMVQINVRDLIDCVRAHADWAAQLPEEDGGAGQVYTDLGVLLSVLSIWHERYLVELDPHSWRWSSQFITQKMFGNLSDLNSEQRVLMGQWISGLFLRSGSGIADELLKPFKELSLVLPVLLQQAVKAYRSAVIDQETLKTGLDYFMQQQSATLLAPLAMRVFYNDLISKNHLTSSLQCIVLFLSLLAPKKGLEFTMTKNFLVPILQKISDLCDLSTSVQTHKDIGDDASQKFDSKTPGRKVSSASATSILDTKSQTVCKLIDELRPIISDLFAQVEYKPPRKPTQPLSYTELATANVTALMNWQLKPQGVPPVPGYLISQRIKPALGAQKTRSLISTVLLDKSQSSLETYWAILVADTWWSSPFLLDAISLNSLEETDDADIQPARELRAQLSRVFENIAELDSQRQDVKIGLPKLANDATNDLDNPMTGDSNNIDADNMEGVELSGANMSLSSNDAMNVDLMSSLGTNQMSTEHTANTGASNEALNRYDYEFDDAQRQDYDTDFSQPMNLADLDSAMDFAWD